MTTDQRPRPPIDPELAAALSLVQVDGYVALTPDVIPAFRARADRAAPSATDLAAEGRARLEDHEARAVDGTALPLLLLRPATAGGPVPAIYFLHGGGMVMGNRRTGIEVPLAWALDADAVVVSPEYRLAPEVTGTTPVEDAYAVLRWLYDHAAELGVDPDAILIAGTSAGGGLAAGVTLLARDRGGPPVLGQVLMCPMLDDRNETPSSHEVIGEGIWDRTANLTGWDALLGAARGAANVSPYAAPARATDLSGLPPAYVDVGSAEVFRDEDVAYALGLWRAGTEAELHVWSGGFHAFDTIAPQARLSRAATQTRAAWVRARLARS